MQDFFTDNLWDKLPGKWSNVLAELQPEEIAYFFLEMYSPLKQRPQSQKPKFRYVGGRNYRTADGGHATSEMHVDAYRSK